MSEDKIKDLVWDVVNQTAKRGPGYSQEGVVLRAISERLGGGMLGPPPDLKDQQAILNAWHDLFMEKRLAWGYDLDNPSAPFFHVR